MIRLIRGKQRKRTRSDKVKILFLFKRHGMGDDLPRSVNLRLREIPINLAKSGFDVQVVCLDHSSNKNSIINDFDEKSRITVPWVSVGGGKPKDESLISEIFKNEEYNGSRKKEFNGVGSRAITTATLMFYSINSFMRTRSFRLPSLVRYLHVAERTARKNNVDLIIGGSDSVYVVAAAWLANRMKVPCIIDLMDNFEYFNSGIKVKLMDLYRDAVKNADQVVCVSNELSEYVKEKYKRKHGVTVVENGIDSSLFYPMEKHLARETLGLPINAQIIGNAGALNVNRGITDLYRAFEIIASENDNIHLVLAGPKGKGVTIPKHPRVHYFGVLPRQEVNRLINSLDVAVICNRDVSYVSYGFPQKTYEIIASRTPLVAACIGPMKNFMVDYQDYLYLPERPESLVDAINKQLKDQYVIEMSVPTWEDQAAIFNKLINNLSLR